MKKIVLSIDGMTCSACSNGLEKYLNKQKGIEKVAVNLVMANALIEYNEEILNKEKIEEFIEEAGFKSLGEFKGIKENDKNSKKKYTFLVFTTLAIILMYISMAHMFKLPVPEILDVSKNAVSYGIFLMSFSGIFVIYGMDIIKNGYKNLVHLIPNMDTLVMVGALSSYMYSLYNLYMVIKGNGECVTNMYFESSAVIIYFIKLGRYIEGVNFSKTKEAVIALSLVTPQNAAIKIEDKEGNITAKIVTIDEVKKGDILVCKPGEKVAVDGSVTTGRAHFDESFITGESKPTCKEKGSKVVAGSLNYDGYIEYIAEKIGKESTVSEIVKMVIEASNTKTNIQRIADKVAGYFVPFVMLIAVISFGINIVITKNFAEAFNTFVTILVVACPCSLGLATPLGIVISEGKCMQDGIVIKNGAVLENAKSANVVVLDKTGTLTYGKMRITETIVYTKKLNSNEIIALVSSIEAKSSHPIASAFIEQLKENNLTKESEKCEVSDINEIAGMGITGKVNKKEVIVGNYKILEKYNVKIEEKYKEKIKEDETRIKRDGKTAIYVILDGEVISIIGIGDDIRKNAITAIKELKENNVQVIMLTGDSKEAAENIAKKVGIDKVIANVLPKEKNSAIESLKKEGKNVIMVGDGINDSVALASSMIGISIESGTDIAMNSSDVILMKNDLSKISMLINISRKTIRNIKQNLFWAFAYNVFMIPVAMGALKHFGIMVTPMMASFAMLLSSVTVVLNSLRLRK